jgi:hypothetical protein
LVAKNEPLTATFANDTCADATIHPATKASERSISKIAMYRGHLILPASSDDSMISLSEPA